MKIIESRVIVVIVLLVLSLPTIYVANAKDRGKIISYGEDGSVCYQADAEEDDAYLKKAEAMINAGQLKKAFDVADKGTPHGCLKNGLERRFAIILRTYKKLGQQAEKAGKFHEAFNYYYYPSKHYFSNGTFREHEKQYSEVDAQRAMLAYARSKANNTDVITEAVRYFEAWENKPPQYKEVIALAEHGGKQQLKKENKEFSAKKYSQAFELLKKAQKWFELTKNEQPVHIRAKQRVDNLLAQTSYNAIEQAMNYTDIVYLGNNYKQSYAAARSRADKLGVEAERNGNLGLAERFYSLAGDDAKHDAVMKKQSAMQERKEQEKEQAEMKRQEKFNKDQNTLEKELGF